MAKKLISIRVDTDLLAWLKDHAQDGYQTMIHGILEDFRRRYELREARDLGRAQQIFVQYHARCFWHMRKDLKITPDLIPLIQQGLRTYGGIEGLRLALELDPKMQRDEDANAHH